MECEWENSTQQANIWRQVFPLHKFTITWHPYIPPRNPAGYTVLVMGQNRATHADPPHPAPFPGGRHPSQSRTDSTRLLEGGFQARENFQLTSLTSEALWDTLHKFTQQSLKQVLMRCSLTAFPGHPNRPLLQ